MNVIQPNNLTQITGPLSLSMTYSLIGNSVWSWLTPTPVGLPDANGNLIGGETSATIIDPLLGPLADNGGFTLPDGSRILTHALLPGSPAINAGDLNLRAGVDGVPEFDERGTPFGRVVNGRIDIGAFEYQAASDLNLLVDTFADESDGNYTRGDLSLREAIELANMWPSVDTIRFDPALTANGPATILLTQGELKITDSLTINGPGADLQTIDASGNDPTPTIDDGRGTRVISIGSAIDVTLNGMTLTGGDSALRGGAVFSKVANSIAIRGSVITGNFTREFGGGVYTSFAKVLIDSTTISDNVAAEEGGGVCVRSCGLTVRASVISGNSARSGGGLWASEYGRLPADISIERSTISGNQTIGDGGGMWVRLRGIGSLSVAESIIEDNLAGQFQPSTGRGGGIYTDVSSTTQTITGTTIHNNSALTGGGAYLHISDGSATLENSQVTSNHAFGAGGSGGGVYVSGSRNTMTIRNSTVDGNTSSFATGGGVFVSGVDLTVQNSTISGNSAVGGGGIYQMSAPLHVLNSTITRNVVRTGSAGGGIAIASPSSGVSIVNTIIAGNYSFPVTPSDIWRSSLTAGFVVQFSLIGSNASSGLTETLLGVPDANGNRIGGPTRGVIDPSLAPLANNGGPTLTHALLPGSPAINAGDPAAAMGVGGVPLHDQRGAPFIRVYGGRIDMGAIESQPATLLGDYNANGVVDAADYVLWRKSNGSNSALQVDGNGDGQVNDADRLVWRANFGQTAATTSVATDGKQTAPTPKFVEVPAGLSPVRRPALIASHPNDFRPSVADHVLATVAASRTAPTPRAAFTEAAMTSSPRDGFTPPRRVTLATVDEAFAAFFVLGG